MIAHADHGSGLRPRAGLPHSEVWVSRQAGALDTSLTTKGYTCVLRECSTNMRAANGSRTRAYVRQPALNSVQKMDAKQGIHEPVSVQISSQSGAPDTTIQQQRARKGLPITRTNSRSKSSCQKRGLFDVKIVKILGQPAGQPCHNPWMTTSVICAATVSYALNFSSEFQ